MKFHDITVLVLHHIINTYIAFGFLFLKVQWAAVTVSLDFVQYLDYPIYDPLSRRSNSE